MFSLFLVFYFNGISTFIAGDDYGIPTLSKGISQKVNIIMQNKFKLIYYNVTVQHTDSPPPEKEHDIQIENCSF